MLLWDLSWPQVDSLSRQTPVIIPIAAVEQHGHHLPVSTDSILLGEIVRRASERLTDQALITPLMWFGNSEHHLDFPGTMTAAPRTYLDLLKEQVNNFLCHGFQRILLVNGHGGNTIPSQQALFEVRQERRTQSDLLLLSVTYWSLGDPRSESSLPFVQSEMGHACEWETSMVLRARPDLVGSIAELPDVPFGSGFAPAQRAWITKDRTAMGHIGSPSKASTEKGDHLYSFFSSKLVDLVERMNAWNGTRWE